MNNDAPINNGQIMHSIGQLTGAIQAMHQGLTARIEDIKDDIKRLDNASNMRMDRIEESLVRQIHEQGDSTNQRIDGLDKRMGDLEKEDKLMIREITKYSFMGGSTSAALVAGIVELLKRI
jgi:t-SNARE complex subunit (syntaxin)